MAFLVWETSFLTASSSQSRNRSFGYMLGQGLSVEEALKRLEELIEEERKELRVHTVKAVYELSESLNIHAPISLASKTFPLKHFSYDLNGKGKDDVIGTVKGFLKGVGSLHTF